ncbi:conserved membrane protein of unknown function [Rhodovastum atsumiense]|uniref:Acyltransferase n=1 Tax=Rhodovastum atsumiense TaxID=504468 RepID=A0A5M6IMH9_9PROT|nr:hypothetical protein [Rhodovastum atsumiense]KAA5609059.1 hypothetical protein F1189_25860 [Rhodovastum atsumiense]CAH2602193.1 conserved membrane protein of unknown function [Rhodovastum atsumiense]
MSNHPGTTAAWFIASPYNLLFFLGIGVGWITTRWRVPGAIGIAALGIAGFCFSGYAENAGWVRNGTPSTLLFGLCSALALLGLVSAEARSRLDFGRTATVMGDLSYPLYLVHGAVGAVAMPLLCRPDLGLSDWAVMILCVGAAVAAASVIHSLFERPVQALLRAAGPRRPTRATAGLECASD